MVAFASLSNTSPAQTGRSVVPLCDVSDLHISSPIPPCLLLPISSLYCFPPSLLLFPLLPTRPTCRSIRAVPLLLTLASPAPRAHFPAPLLPIAIPPFSLSLPGLPRI